MSTSSALDAAEAAVDEVAALARLTGALVDQLTVPVRDTHRAISGRVFRILGPASLPVQVVHDGVAGAVYASVRGGGRVAGAVAGSVLAATHPEPGRDRRPVSAHPLGAQTLSFLSGLLGDWLDGRADGLRVRLTLSHHGRPIPLHADSLTDGLAEVLAAAVASDRVVLLVHGLAETVAAWTWWRTGPDGEDLGTYAERLQAEGWTPLEVTYDTGHAVADSGAEVAALLALLDERWPVPLSEIALVGHSMGGLVVSAALATGADDDAGWVDRVSHVVTLGTPHRGSWFAQAAAGAVRVLGRVPETAPIAGVIDLRSAGIRDLTHGHEPIELAHAEHWYVTASLGHGPSHPAARFLGDGLVHHASAAPTPEAAERGRVRNHPRTGHVRLVNHRAVADDLVTWLGPRRSPVAAPAPRPGPAPGAAATG